MPSTAEFVLDKFGVEDRSIEEYKNIVKAKKIEVFNPIFPRLEREKIELKEVGKEEIVEGVQIKINYDDLQKLTWESER